METQLGDGIAVLAAMATPAVLLLANAMLVLSSNQRLQAILDRVRETELAIAGEDVVPETTDLKLLNELLLAHAKRARAAHRALLCLYCSAATFVIVVLTVGLGGLGFNWAVPLSLLTAFVGCALLFCGAILLIAETRLGITAIDRRFDSVMDLCRQLAERRGQRSS